MSPRPCAGSEGAHGGHGRVMVGADVAVVVGVFVCVWGGGHMIPVCKGGAHEVRYLTGPGNPRRVHSKMESLTWRKKTPCQDQRSHVKILLRSHMSPQGDL